MSTNFDCFAVIRFKLRWQQARIRSVLAGSEDALGNIANDADRIDNGVRNSFDK